MLNHPSVNLLDHQINHVESIWRTLQNEFSYIDTSQTGLGKTVTSLYLAWLYQQKYGGKIMVVAPSELSLKNKDGWLFWADQFGLTLDITITYSKLVGRNNKVKHPFLIPDENKKKWSSSPEFREFCQNGLFIIFDEYHKCKNNSTTHYAAAALVRTAKRYKRSCRVSLLSHTPGNKPEHSTQILRMAGIITDTILYKHVPFSDIYNWEDHGLGELYLDCTRRSQNQVSKWKIEDAMQRISATRANSICQELFTSLIRPEITFAMPAPETEVKIEMFNAFLESDPEGVELLNRGIAMLQNGVAWNGQDVGDKKEWSLGVITKGLKLIEMGKISGIINYIKEENKKNPQKKFVICCGAMNTDIHDVIKKRLFKTYCPDRVRKDIKAMSKVHPGWHKIGKDCRNIICNYVEYDVPPDVMNGKVKPKERVKIMENFQKNTNDSWCLVMSPGVGAESISVHDKWGDHPREMLIIPDYHFGRVIQSAGRINRVGIKSDVKIMMVYGKQGQLETKILHSMIRKTKTAKELLADGQKVLFPGEYPFWIQGEKDIQLENTLKELQRV